MFTGLVECTAEITRLDRRGPEARMAFAAELDAIELGESINCSGVCLTVVRFDDKGFEADVSQETLAVTSLGKLSPGDRVNIERSCRVGDRLGGHIVLGHTDAVGRVSAVEPVGEARRFEVEAPTGLARYWAPKGSVTVDGVSLTINGLVGDRGFFVMLVPHTLAVTTLGDNRAGDAVNLEIDVLGRYVARQLDHAGITKSGDDRIMDALRRGGFIE